MDTKIMDYTTERKQAVDVSVTYHSAVDLLLALWAIGSKECGDPIDEIEIGDAFFDELVDKATPETAAALAEIGSGDTWIAMLSLVPAAGEGGSVTDFIEFLEGHNSVDLRSRMIWLYQEFDRSESIVAARAAAGDEGAVDQLLELPAFDHTSKKAWRESLRYLLSLTPDGTRDVLVSVLRDVLTTGFASYEEEFRGYLEADAKSKKSMAMRLSPERLVEIATNGISIEERRIDTPVLLVPTMVARPWVVLAESPEMLIMGYPVSDRTLRSDPDAPPQWLVKLHKALGDERRLKILRRLAQNDASLVELTKELDISKSTLHHHMMLLRAAGLIKVHMGEDKRYSLRDETLPEAATYLNHYIHKSNETREETT
jgi:DNA-binding transcriptional ArsR family regulator